MLFNLVFPNNTISSCVFLFFLIIDLDILISTVIAKMFNPTAELAMLVEIPTRKAKAEMKTDTVTAEAKISKCSI